MAPAADRAQAQTATITAQTGQSCAGTRAGSNLGCTSNDFSSTLTFDQPAATALASCIAGTTVSIDILASTTSNSPVRYDGAYFIGEMATSPALNDATKTCSLGVFPLSPAPFQNSDSDACGDYAASSTSSLLINDVNILCKPTPGTNALSIPYTLVFNNQGGSTPACTAANVTASNNAKCVSNSTSTVTGVTVNSYVKVTKQTTPDADTQSFGFTATTSGTTTVSPSSFSLTDNQSQVIQIPFNSTGSAHTVTVTEAATGGWYPNASIVCTTPTGASASSYVTVNNATRTITANLTTTNFGAECVITNTKIPTFKLQKKTLGGTGTFAFSSTNLATTPSAITTTAVNTTTPSPLSSVTAHNATAINTAITIAETAVSGYRATAATCADAQSSVTGNTGSSWYSLPGSSSATPFPTLTINSTAVKPGAQFNCEITNSKVPLVRITKVTSGNTSAAGPFSFSTSTNLVTTPSLSTSGSGSGNGQTSSAIEVSTIGTSVVITETAVSGYSLASASCTDTNASVSGNPTGTIGSLSGASYTIPAANVVAGADFSCTFTNNKTPTVTVAKLTLGNSAASPSFSFTASNLAQTINAVSTTGHNVAATATPTAILVSSTSSNVVITEGATTGYSFASVACIDANSGLTGNTGTFWTSSGSTLTLPAAVLLPGAAFTCTFTNNRTPTVTVRKLTLGNSAASPSFSFTASNLAQTINAVSTTGHNVAATATPTAIEVSSATSDVVITEGSTAGYAFSAVACTDANSSLTGNTGTFWTSSGLALTLPSSVLLPGAAFTCTFTNNKDATVKLQKTITAGVGGSFGFTLGNLALASTSINATSIGTPTPASPSAMTVTTLGSAVTIQETPVSGYSVASASCSDANSGITGNTGSFYSLSGTTLTITAANVLPGSDITCVFTNSNAAVASLSISKSASTAGPVNVDNIITYTYSVTNTGNVALTGISVSDVHNAFGSAPAPDGETLFQDVAPLSDSSDASSADTVWSTLGPGDTVHFSWSYTVVQADIDNLQ